MDRCVINKIHSLQRLAIKHNRSDKYKDCFQFTQGFLNSENRLSCMLKAANLFLEAVKDVSGDEDFNGFKNHVTQQVFDEELRLKTNKKEKSKFCGWFWVQDYGNAIQDVATKFFKANMNTFGYKDIEEILIINFYREMIFYAIRLLCTQEDITRKYFYFNKS